jgi:molybdopterin biosynthesis enzyme
MDFLPTIVVSCRMSTYANIRIDQHQNVQKSFIVVHRCRPNILLNVIHSTLQHVDVLITTGGVSMGERDLIADVLIQDFNAQLLFGRLKMKPG